MTKRNKLIAGGAVAVVLTAIAFTLLNKKWWVSRIVAKWDLAIIPNAQDASAWTVTGNDLTKFSIPQLFTAWKDGQPGWALKGTLAELDTTTEFDIQ